ncbi:MAG TPA: FkbM family methyltransferase [Flavipsychrobacter sp.]|nr:FkbM family methyltransferase [Flavipsychrobacter sp.]
MTDRLNAVLAATDTNRRQSELSKFCKTSDVVLYGAGLTGKHILTNLLAHGIRPLFIADDTPAKQFTEIEGIKIVPLAHLETITQPYALVVTMLNPQMDFHRLSVSLNERGIRNVYSFIELSFLFPESLLPYFHFGSREDLLQDTNAIKQAFDLFTDQLSKDIFIKNLDFRITLDFAKIPLGDKDDYFPESVVQVPDQSVFFDCGAFNGDTVNAFIQKHPKFDKIYAFEPDAGNFNKLLQYCAGLNEEISERIFVYNFGLSAQHRFLKFNSLGNMASSIDDAGNEVIQTIHLDSFLPSFDGYNNSIFIKMDIEGEEPNALRGCEQLIRNKKPHLAISAYHNVDDLWRIPLYLHSLHSSYRFYLRQHGNDSMDLVLYAIAS